MDNATASTVLAVLRPQTLAIERVPAIVDFNFLPDMGRMNLQCPWAESHGFSVGLNWVPDTSVSFRV